MLSDNDLNGKNKSVGGNDEKVSAEHPDGVLHGALPYAHGGVRRRRADDRQHRRGGGNTDNPDYKIEDESIKLLTRDVTYVLTGTTDKKIYIWGRNSENDAGEATYIRANNVVVNGGIESYNQVKLVLEVPEGTDNTIAKVYAHDLKIYGAGTLHSNKLGVKQATSFLPSALNITDTKVIVNCPANSSGEWNGACVLDGNADVTYTACGDYAPLQIGVKSGDITHSLTMKDNAKLRCLHAAPDTPSASSVSGLEIFNGANLTMSGNSYLEVQGKPTTGQYAGYGLVSSANVSVTENAAIKATGYDVALSVGGDLAISGGNVEAKSENSNGIYADGKLEISDGAKVNASGYYPALFGSGSVSIKTVRSRQPPPEMQESSRVGMFRFRTAL